MSQAQYANLPQVQGSATDALSMMRTGYNHERRYRNAAPVDLYRVRDLVLKTKHENVPLRLYKPTDDPIQPVILYSHGARLHARQSGYP